MKPDHDLDMEVIEQLSTEELVRRADEAADTIAAIKGKVEAAQAHQQATGEWADPKWFARAKHALRMRGREHQVLLREIAKRRKQERESKGRSMEHHFMDVAKEVLDQATFHAILRAAVMRTGGENG